MIEQITTIISLAVIGAAYATFWRLTKNADPTKDTEKLDATKIVSTAIIGAGIGVLSVLMGFELNQETVFQYLFMAGGLIAVVERLISTGYNYIKQGEPNV